MISPSGSEKRSGSARGALVAGLACLLGSGCGPTQADLEAVDFKPIARNDWAVSTPADQGVDPQGVAELYFHAGQLETLYSLLVVKNGFLIAEKYFGEGAVDRKDRIQSATKSITSALVGIAIDQGIMPGVDSKMLDFFPEIAGTISDQRKRKITIRQMLQMRTGYPWEEDDADLWQGLLSGHYLPLIEAFPLVDEPGTRFHYSNLTSNWLGIIVARAAQTNLRAFAQAHLFSLIGAQAGDWGTDADGHNNGCGDLHLTARDMARFGLLILDEGLWEGEQVIPTDWVKASLQTYSLNEFEVRKIGPLRNLGYGYHWWSGDAGRYHVNMAWGHGGQLIVLVEELDMAIVTTAYPFWLEHNSESWKHEKAIIAMVADFIRSL